ncbi:hypothetical protein J2S74_005482 [Evansella vedderi]|uniref:J domain-containing protein n=1 Tax=Evansella vedderi TaxID=38282 RepID=A0ABU0A3G3_9BACI|nr:hypothetical protein [Evansella vedderi]MDQ0258019.1 hypothetical protein [Evansella vedderi]
MDIQKAYEILDISRESSIEEIEEKYFLWIRIAKAQEQKGITDPNELINMDEITEAFNVIRNHLLEEASSKEGKKPKSPFREKMDHFFDYYKFHTVAAVFTLILAFFLIQSIVENRQEQARLAALPPVDIEIMMYGEYFNDDISPLENNIAAMFPDWERIEVNLVYGPTEVTTEFDIGAVQKNAITLMMEVPDIYIMDLHHFRKFFEDGPFQPLDPILENEVEQLEDDRLYYLQMQNDDQERLYGIDIAGSDIFNGVELVGKEKIAIIRLDADKEENAITFLQSVINGLTEE